MIRYTSANQLSIEDFEHPFAQELSPNNRWVILAFLVPWNSLAMVYAKNLKSHQGRLCVDIRMVIGAIIIKHKLGLSDRETVKMIEENIYLQYFCGLKSFQTTSPFDATLFVDIRKRMGADKFDAFNDIIIAQTESLKPPKARIASKGKQAKHSNKQQSLSKQHRHSNKETKEANTANKETGEEQEQNKKQEEESKVITNKGTLKVDATVADQQIVYPTDLGLLNRSREESERLIDILYKKSELKKKPRTYRKKARAAYLSVAKKKKKNKKELRKAIGAQLRYLKRDLQHIEHLLDLFDGKKFPLKHREQKIYWVIQHIYQQQKYMYDNKVHRCKDRIVNIYQPYVRAIVRGKDKIAVEFGSKLSASEYEGMSKVNRISWDAFNESLDLQMQVENFKKTFGCYPELLLADSIYLNRENRKWLKDRTIRIVGKPLGRPPAQELSAYQKRKQKKERNQRNHIEGKFGQGKYAYGLKNIKARRQDTSESWISAIFFIMNIVTLLKVAEKWGAYFLSFIFGVVIQQIKIIFYLFSNTFYRKRGIYIYR